MNSKDSNIQRNLLDFRDKIDVNILWKINVGNNLFWWDKWSPTVPIRPHFDQDHKPGNTKVHEFLLSQSWNMAKLLDILPASVTQDISLAQIGMANIKDQAIWTLTTQGTFSCASGFQSLRQKKA